MSGNLFVLMYYRHKLLEIVRSVRQWNQCSLNANRRRRKFSSRGKLQRLRFVVS
jgi:hypothetical protein